MCSGARRKLRVQACSYATFKCSTQAFSAAMDLRVKFTTPKRLWAWRLAWQTRFVLMLKREDKTQK